MIFWIALVILQAEIFWMVGAFYGALRAAVRSAQMQERQKAEMLTQLQQLNDFVDGAIKLFQQRHQPDAQPNESPKVVIVSPEAKGLH